jgi:hypothetical protein
MAGHLGGGDVGGEGVGLSAHADGGHAKECELGVELLDGHVIAQLVHGFTEVGGMELQLLCDVGDVMGEGYGWGAVCS